MGSLTDFPIDQVDSIGVDIEVNNLSDEHFRDVMEELTNHQIPERDKCSLVRRLNASISGYFKSTGDVGFSKMGPAKANNNNNTNHTTTNSKPGNSSLAGDLSISSGNNHQRSSSSSNHGVDNGNSIELIEYRRTFEYKNYHSPKSYSKPSDIQHKSSERTKGSIGVNSSSTTSATIHPHHHPSSSTSSTANNISISNSSSSPSSSSNATQNGSNVDSFVNFDTLKRPPCELNELTSNEPTEGKSLNDSNPPSTTPSTLNTINVNASNLSNNTNHLLNNATIINNITNDTLSIISRDVSKETTSTANNKETKDNGNNTNQTTNDANNNAKGNRNGKEKKKKAKDKNLYKTVYTAQDIDGHIGDKPIEDLVYYVTGNKGEIVTSPTAATSNQGVTVTTTITTSNINSGSGIASGSNSSTTTSGSNSITVNPGPVSVSTSSSVTSSPAGSGVVGVASNNIGASVQCGSSSCDNNKLATNSKSNKESGNVGGKVKKKDKSTAASATATATSSSLVNNSTNQGRNKKGSNNIIPSSITTISTSTNNINLDNTLHATSSIGYCASNGNISDTNVKKLGSHVEKPTNCSVNSGLGKSIPRSSSATTFDSKFSPSSSSSSSNVAQSEVNSSMDAPLTSPSLSKSHSIESSSSSSLTSIQQNRHQPVTKINTDPGITVSSKSKVKENNSITTTTTMINSNVNKDSTVTNIEGLKSKKSDTSASSTHVATTANRDLDNYKELRYSASDPETADQDSSFQPVKSKHLKRRKAVSRNKTVSVGGGVGDLRMPSPSPRSSNTIFTTSNSSSSTSTIPSSVTSSNSNSVNISMTARGYESEREYCADEYRRRKEYLNHRKLASSMPHSEQNSADNSDMESSCSYPVSGRMPILPTPPGPPASSNNSISSTPKVSYADIAKMGSVAVTPPVVVTGNGGTGGSMTNIKGPSPTNITINSSDGIKDANNNISTSSITGSTENSPKNGSTVDSGLSLQTNLSPSSNSCSPYPSSSPNCISPSGFSPSSSSPSNQTIALPEGSKASKNHNATTANNQIKSSSPPPSTESTLDATTLSKDNPPTIKSETNFDQEISSKDGKSIGTSSANSSSQMLSAAVAIRPKDFDTSRETKMENQKVICEDNSTNSTKQAKNVKKMEKTTIQLSTSSSTTSSSSSTASTLSTVSPQQTSTASTRSSTIVAKSSGKTATNSKTLEALLSPPVEKTPTFDTKKENINKLNARIASIKSDIPSRASMLKKSNSIPGANVKNNSCYRVNITESINNTSKSLTNKLPSSLPPVIMNDDSDGTDEIETTFTFGFFDDVASSLKNSSSSSSTIKPSSSASSKPSSATTTTTTTTSSLFSSTTIKPVNSVMMTSKSSSKPSTVKNNFDKTANSNNANSSSSISRVKSTKNASNSSLTHSTVTSSTTITTATIKSTPSANTTNNSVKSDKSRSALLEAAADLPSEKKNSSKDSKSTSGNGNNNTSLEKFMAIKLAEPSTNMDADINTFNYSQIINFIKTAWESVMCQYHCSPDKNNSHSSSSTTQTLSASSSSKGADLFCESTIYYKCEMCKN